MVLDMLNVILQLLLSNALRFSAPFKVIKVFVLIIVYSTAQWGKLQLFLINSYKRALLFTCSINWN